MQYILLLIILWGSQFGYAQNKTDIPSTYSEVCFYTIKKEAFEEFLRIKKAVDREEYGAIYGAIRKMRNNLKGFAITEHNRAFELWYLGNYTEFEEQVQVALNSTLASLKSYESRLRTRDAVYYDHRLFLEQYLAFKTEAFYPVYWFMSQERYFSRFTVERITSMNKEGYKLFVHSEFYRPFEAFNEMAKLEEYDIKDYLDIQNLVNDTTVYIPYSYMTMDKSVATYVLQNLVLDDATQKLDVDRQVSSLKKFLNAVKDDAIYLVARFNHLELRRLKAIEEQQKKALDE